MTDRSNSSQLNKPISEQSVIPGAVPSRDTILDNIVQIQTSELRLAAAEDEQQLRRLVQALRNRKGRFGLLFAVCNEVPLRKKLTQQIIDNLPDQHPIELQLSGSEPSLLDTLLAAPDTPEPLIVHGIELLLPSADSQKARREQTLQELQLRREQFRKLARPLLLWMPEYVYTLIGQQAIDFWSWQGGGFFFTRQQPTITHDKLMAALEHLAAGTGTDVDIQVLRQALQAGQIALASGERAVALGGNASDTIIVSGDSNIVLKGGDAMAIRQALASLFPPRLHQPPPDLLDFTGREQLITELTNALRNGSNVLIHGMAGVGKTALALHIAQNMRDDYPDGQLFIPLRSITDDPRTPADGLRDAIRAFDPVARLPNDIAALTAIYRPLLSGKRALIIVDDALDAAAVRPLLLPPPCALIVTSRRAIALPGLHALNLDALPEKEARHLLQTIVGKDRATEKELNTIALLCGRLPLALRMAGTSLVVHPDWTAGKYIQALTDEHERLARLKQDDLDVEAALGLSAAQLAREQPDLAVRWQMLIVFPATFDRAAAAAVWAVTEKEACNGLSVLVERSLLLYDAESTRYRLHDLMRPVARNAFSYGGGEPDPETERQRLEEAAARHAVYYKTVAATANNLYLQGGEALKRGLNLFDLEWRNIQAGQAWAETHARENNATAELCSAYALSKVLELRQHPHERICWLEAALAATRRLRDHNTEGIHLGRLGDAYYLLGETHRAIEFFEQYLTIAREVGDRHGEGDALGRLGNAYSTLGETHRAIEFFEQYLTIAREVGDRHGEGDALGRLGNAYYYILGDHSRAIEMLQQALTIAREVGDRRSEGVALGNLGYVYSTLGETRRAIEFFEQALVIARDIGDRRGEGVALGNLGIAYKNLGDVRRAIEYYEQKLVIAREVGDRRGEGAALGNLGMDYGALGQTRRAIEFFEQQLVITREIGDRHGEGQALGNLGRAYVDLGEARRAIEFFEQSLAIAREVGHRRAEGAALGSLGWAYTALGDARRAIEFFEQSLAIAREVRYRRAEGATLGNLGTAYVDLGEPHRAIEFFKQNLAITREIGDRRGEGYVLWKMSLASDKLGDRDQATAHAEAALKIFEQIENPNAAKVRKQLAEWREQK